MNTSARIQWKKVILVVEDSLSIQKILQRVFASMPEFQVRFAENGKEALAMIEASTPNMIISDVHMPELDGIQLLSILKSNKQWEDIPFIFLTGDESDETKIIAFETGADDYLVKPFNKIDLFIRTRSILKRYSKTHLQKVQDCLYGLLTIHNISDIIQMSAVSNSMGSLIIQHNNIDTGYINIIPSKIHSAEYKGIYGEESLPLMLSLTSGSFIYKPEKLITIRNDRSIINKPIMKSLLAAAQRKDQGESDFMIFAEANHHAGKA